MLLTAQTPRFAFDSPATASAAIAAHIRPVEAEQVALEGAAGRALFEPVRTDRPSPAADVSAMDGFAVRLADLVAGRLVIAGEVRIGQPPPPCPSDPAGAGCCFRITTGGAVPAWADAVVKREDVRERTGVIEFDPALAGALEPGTFIRRRGENAREGEEIAPAGMLLSPAAIGAIAGVGCTTVRVHRALKVAVLSTGDELAPPGSTPTAWQTRDCNGPALAAMLGAIPWIDSVERRTLDDDPARLDAALAELLATVDALVLSGGVSAGWRDFVPGALARLGVRPVVHGVPQRPGRPFLGGVTADGRLVFGLPGNPVSALVTARRLAVPLLARRAGLSDSCPPRLVHLENDDGQSLHLWWHRLVRLTGEGTAALAPTKSSGDGFAAARSDGFVEIPPGQSGSGPWPFYGWGET